MDMDMIFEIIKLLAVILCGGLALYYRTNAKLNNKVDSFINEAEKAYSDLTKAGGQKFDFVVTKLYALVPTAMKPFITREMIGQLVQGTFDAVEAYSKKQLDKVTDEVIK